MACGVRLALPAKSPHLLVKHASGACRARSVRTASAQTAQKSLKTRTVAGEQPGVTRAILARSQMTYGQPASNATVGVFHRLVCAIRAHRANRATHGRQHAPTARVWALNCTVQRESCAQSVRLVSNPKRTGLHVWTAPLTGWAPRMVADGCGERPTPRQDELMEP